MKKLRGILLSVLAAGILIFPITELSAKEGSWSKITDATQRYQVLSNFSNAAVMDRETGLIWEQCPSTSTAFSWADAKKACYFKNVGGRMGWRLPTYEELMSLGDPGVAPFLPNNHGFCSTASAPCVPNAGCFGSFYWTSTANPSDSFSVLGVFSSVGDSQVTASRTEGQIHVWCVRGGQSQQSNP